MRPNPSSQVVNIGNETENVKLGLDLTAAAHLISVLTDLYSDPIAAVVREYSTNALDSHIEAGNSAPIEVTLPTTSNPVFKVRDYGLGLNINGIRDTYSLYGSSTKRNSDDVNGMLGLGCKSALTYAQSFNIMGVKDGVKVLATVVKDIDGVGVIKILDTVTTNEPNGVEISIPCKSLDVSKFAETAKKFYYVWKKGTVLVNGKEPEAIWDDSNLVWLDDSIAVEPGPQYGSNHYIVQHNVSYPCIIDGLPPRVKIIAFVPVGSVNFTPSREALHYTPRTKETILTLKNYINEHLMRILEDKANKGATPWERAKTASNWAAVLRTSFKGINLHIKALQGHSVFYGRGSQNYGRQAEFSKEFSISIHHIIDEEKHLVVTGHNLRTITQLSKLRMRDYRDTHGFKGATLLPDDCEGLDLLRGRKNVVPWTKIVAETEHVRTQRARGESREETLYYCRQGDKDLGGRTLKEIADMGLPVTYGIGTNHAGGTFPEVITLNLQVVSVNRVKKKFPDAKEIWHYQRERIKECRDALTKEDLENLAAQKDPLIRKLSHISPVLVKDPLLAQGLKALTAKSATMDVYRQVGGDLHSLTTPGLYKPLEKRYPMVSVVPGITSAPKDDIVLYLNCKYQTLQGKQEIHA